MKHLILYCTMSLLMLQAGAQSARKIRTITASFSKHSSSSGDTAFFSYDGASGNLTRYFNRNLRMPMEDGVWETGTCNLYFMIDTAGHVTKTWCDSVTNEAVAKEVLRVAGKLTSMKPTTIRGKPVITKVRTTVIMMYANGSDSNYPKADLLVIGYEPARKKLISR